MIDTHIDALADSGSRLAARHAPEAALEQWLHGYTELLAAKRGLATALHSGDTAFAGLADYLLPALGADRRSAP